MFRLPTISATTIDSPTQIPTSNIHFFPSSILSVFFFNSPLRDDLLINFLVSVFTPYKNFTSVGFNLGRMCLKQISSHFTTTSHKESLSPIVVESFFCKTCVFIALERRQNHLLSVLFMLRRCSRETEENSSFSVTHKTELLFVGILILLL